MRWVAAGIVAALLAGCATPPRDLPLADLDLANGTTLSELQAALPPDDRAALGTYALLHWPKSKFYCGDPIDGAQVFAKTVGEAIAQTHAYEALLARAQAQTPAIAASSSSTREKALVMRMDQLVLQRDMLHGRLGPGADTSPEGLQIKQQLAALRSELAVVRGGTGS